MNIGIIGTGIMGLSLAYKLSTYGYKVHLLEKETQIGGLSTWHDYGDFIWDKYYHVILKSDVHLLSLVKELGISDKMFWMPTKTGFLWKGQHLSMSNHLEFLQFPVLNIIQKARLAAGILYSHYLAKPEDIEHLTAKNWLTKVFGKGVFRAIWEPLLESKFGMLKDKVPATIIHSIMNRYYSTRSKANGKEWMGHLQGCGMKVLCESLANKIKDKQGKIDCGIKVLEIGNNQPNGVNIHCEKTTFTFDKVISTLPTMLLKKIGPDLEGIYQDGPDPTFLGVIRLAMVLKQSLSPFYVTNLIDKGLPFTGIIEVSALTESHEMSGNKLVMLPRYDVPSSTWFNKSEEEIRSIFIENLKPTWPNIEDNIISSCVHKERIVQALWIDRPPTQFQPAHTTDGKIWSINAELAGRDTLNNNAIIEVANQAAEIFFNAHKQQT